MRELTGIPEVTKGVYLLIGKSETSLRDAFYGLYNRITRNSANQVAVFQTFLGNLMSRTEIEALYNEAYERGVGRQRLPLVASTMHPWAVDHLPIVSAEDVRARLMFAGSSGRAFVLEDDELDRFMRAFEAGIQYLSEILLTEGFW